MGELDSTDWQKYQTEAAPCYPHGVRKSWCGVFVTWVLRQAGLIDYHWTNVLGIIYRLAPKWKTVSLPKPGDVGVKHEPNAHHFFVRKVVGSVVFGVAGNAGSYPGHVGEQMYALDDPGVDYYPMDAIVDVADAATSNTDPPPGVSVDGLRRGDKGDAVGLWQRRLMALGYDLAPWNDDGDFGSLTEKRTREYQQAVLVTGVVDANTRKAAGL
jgi:hypothetical protein